MVNRWAEHPALDRGWAAALGTFRERPFVPVQEVLAVGLPTSTFASSWTTRSIANSCTAPHSALRKPTCQPRPSLQSMLAGSSLCFCGGL